MSDKSEPGSWRKAEGILEGVFKPGEADKALRHARGDYDAEMAELEQARKTIEELKLTLYSVTGYADAYCRGIAPYVDDAARIRHMVVMDAAHKLLQRLIPGLVSFEEEEQAQP